jgi:uncharacterized membrane protein
MNAPLTPQARLASLGCLVALALTSQLPAQSYTIKELPPLPGDNYAGAFALNEAGQAAGFSGQRAVIWNGGVPRNLQTVPGATSSVAFGLNDSGQAAGQVFPTPLNSSSFFWNGSTMQVIAPPPADYLDAAYALNNLGVVIGTGGPTFGYRWSSATGGSPQAFGVLAGDNSAYPNAINNFGITVGRSRGRSSSRPVIWVGTSPQAVPMPEGATGGQAWGISDAGTVVGEYYLSGSTRPFLWTSGSGLLALPLPAGAPSAVAWSVNSAGVIIGWAGSEPIIWRKNASGVYEAISVASLITNGSGWSGLNLYAINDAGQIAGNGSLNGEERGFILSPGPSLVLVLRTDLDRSGSTDLESAADATAPGRPFYFWTNDDSDATGTDVAGQPADSADNRVMTPVLIDGLEVMRPGAIRDFEDFARLSFKLSPEVQAALSSGARLSLKATGAGTIHLFSTPGLGAETRYLTDEAYAESLISQNSFNVALTPIETADGAVRWENLEALVTPADRERERLSFLWEGITPGICVLTISLLQPDGSEISSEPVHLSLRHVSDFYARVQATPSEGFPAPWDTDGAAPAMGWEFVHHRAVTPPEQQNVDLVWVHGWRLTPFDQQNWAEMMFKRLWHARYQGRFYAFVWPTRSGDDSILNGFLTFDESEYRAWKSGAALEGFLRTLRPPNTPGRLTVVAHSMGNIVTGEAFRRGAPAHLQIMMQAAVSAGCYDARTDLDDAQLIANEQEGSTPDLAVNLGYRNYLAAVSVPTINFFNTEDYALQTGKAGGLQVNWFSHQSDKPHDPRGRGHYANTGGVPGFYVGKKLLREVQDSHESMAFIARSRTKPVGTQPQTNHTVNGAPLGNFVGRRNLQQDFGFTNQANEHSAQFNRPIQRQLIPFYLAIAETAFSASAP